MGTARHLRAAGFQGFMPMRDLALEDVPHGPGVYAVLAAGQQIPLVRNVGGWFKSKDPTVDLDRLASRIIPGTELLYIGKADSGSKGKRGLRSRIKELIRFGNGEPVGHWGGRYLWQLSDPFQNLIAWLPTSGVAAEEVEKRLLREFLDEHGVLPFANLRM
jgi:hypothetical protein